MNERPVRLVRVRRYALEQIDTLELPLGDEPLILPGDRVPLEWLPPEVHRLRVGADGVATVQHTEHRLRPARVPLFNGRAMSFRSAPHLSHGDCVSFGEPLAATFLSGDVRDQEIEAQLGTDLGARAVYADALQEAGDPLGEALALAGDDGPPAAWTLAETRLPMVEVDVAWRRGFAHDVDVALLDPVTFPSGVLRVLHARVFAFVSALTVRFDVARAIAAPLDARLARHLPASLVSLHVILGQREAPLRSEVDALHEAVRARCPGAAVSVAVDPTRAEPSVERMVMNLRGKQ